MYVLSGGNRPALFNRFYAGEIELIKTTKRPVLGICMGFELIAAAFGSTIIRQSELINGVIPVRLESGFFESSFEYVQVAEAHRWKVIRTELDVLATSEYGIEALKHPNRPIFGFQFHPEVTIGGSQGQNLMNQVLEYCEVYNRSLVR